MERESETTTRLKAMAKAFDAGVLTTVNGSNPKRNYDDMPDDTIYAGGAIELERDENS